MYIKINYISDKKVSRLSGYKRCPFLPPKQFSVRFGAFRDSFFAQKRKAAKLIFDSSATPYQGEELFLLIPNF